MRFLGRKANTVTAYAKLLRQDQYCPNVSKRWLQISTSSSQSFDLHPPNSSTTSVSDAKFAIIGGSCPLLSVSLSASQHLYTRSGTLVGVAGKAENTVSTLSLLEPFSRTLLRIPFFYRKLTSTTPVTALISAKGANAAITAVHLDGTTDWMLAGQSLLAWTGRTLSLRPIANLKMAMAHWGNSQVTGRGLLALVGRGSVSEIDLKDGDSYVIHPSYVVGYTVNSRPPTPYRLKSSSFRLQVPSVGRALVSDTRFFKLLRESTIWQTILKMIFNARTWIRTFIWADRMFLQFHGPTTILLQTRASSIRDTFLSTEVNETAEAQPGAIRDLLKSAKQQNTGSLEKTVAEAKKEAPTLPNVHMASVGKDGKVSFVKADR